MHLAQIYPLHGGIVLAQQKDWMLASLIAAVDHMMIETNAEDWPGQVRWLNDWRA